MLGILLEVLDLSDGVGYIGENQYPLKWPKTLKKSYPEQMKAQSIHEAFQWPVKALRNLQGLKETMKNFKPVLLSNRELTISSNFSGICSQSRGACILQSHGFGCRFRHVDDSASLLTPSILPSK